ncbi:tyrosine-protein kinase JAK2-like isoform X2 [Bolinopsis microptera]|uniref:tyrosine-protein kinase JAK2-like isoform X2 n=1 Tax=Bolinopsis microptera TaxID=2820187 RepID=UPI003079BAD3
MNIRISEDCTEGPMAFTLLFKYVRDIVAGLKFLHNHNIVHTLPAPQHILLDQVSNKLKLFDAGFFGKLFTSSSHPRHIIQQSESFEVSVLRWMSETSIFKSEALNSTYQDRWVFGITVWQIFNNGSIPLGKHSNEELLNRYLKIKEQQNCGNMASNIPFQGWFPLKLDIPKQDDLTVNKKIQKLVNYTITDHLNDQEDAFEEIADLFNNDVFPLDRSVNIYEKLERNTEMKIEKKDGRLYFRRQQITAPSQPSVYSQSLDPVYDYGDSNVFDVHTDCSDGSDYSSSIDCENVDPETDFSNSGPVPDWYHQATTSDAFNYFSDNCDNSDPFYNDELSFTLLQECELQNQLHKFNNKKWESSFYKLGETVGAGNFGEVCKAIVQDNERIPPELRRREIAVKIFSLPAAHDNAIETIVQEAENMLRLEHNRIVPLYGISSSLENKEIHIIMPFYQMGSLKSYIRQFHNELKEKDLCLFGLQIAEGMEYLNSKGFVHRDLALRNILVVSHKNVRIADLGLTRGVVKDQDYYYFVNKSMKAGLPTLWYPPEFFNKSKYDKYCDVWSYGVTMFEMWSNGEIPYKRYRVQKQPELIEFLKTRTLDIPEGTPRIFVHVMKRCWKEKRERWDFTAIVNFIKSKLSSPRYTTENPEDTYIYTQSRVCGGSFATQKVPVKETTGLKILNPFNFTEASKDVENRDPEIQYNELTVRRYKTAFSEDHIKKILGLKHRHMMQYVGYVYTEGLLYSAAPVHSIGTLHDWCASARADMFTKKKGYAAQVLQGMLFLLSQNITHGSLSIHNVWLRDNYCAVISEAGMVDNMRSDKLTHQNVITYPLEVLEGMVEDQEVMLDPRTDTWMFGVMLLHMFSPEPLYSQVRPEGDAATVMEVCESICGVLKKDISALCVETIRPAEIKSALSLCFTEVNVRGDVSVLKLCFQT